MGLANWVVGKMVDSFLAQPPAEKAAVFDTMATKFWESATPDETAQIAELLLPRFMEAFLESATAEQKTAMLQSMLDPARVESMTMEMLPDFVTKYLQGMSPEQWQAFLPEQMRGMPGMPGSSGRNPDAPRPPKGPGGMMPW